MLRRIALTLVALCLPGLALAQGWVPERPVRIILPGMVYRFRRTFDLAARPTAATARSGRVKGHNGAVSAAGRHSTRQGHHAGEKAAVGVRVLTEDRGRGLRGERIVQVAEKKEEEKLADKIIMNQLQ